MKNRRNLLAILFLVLFAFNYAGNVWFLHLHYIDGTVVVHSHPFSASNHTHSSEEYACIFHLNNLLYLDSCPEYSLDIISSNFVNSGIGDLSFSINSLSFGTSDLRAPPYSS